MTVDKNGETWQFSTAGLKGLTVQLGDTVTVYYQALMLLPRDPRIEGLKVYQWTGVVKAVDRTGHTIKVSKGGEEWEFATPPAASPNEGEKLTVYYVAIAKKIESK